MKNQQAGAKEWHLISDGSGNGPGVGFLEFVDFTDSSTKMVIGANGNVGIGTTIPKTTLDVAGGISVHGTTFTAAGCTNSTLVGGSTVGSFKIGQATSCTITITMGNSQTASNGWSCWVNDLTAVPAVAFRQSATTTTTAAFTGTGATNDVFTFGCIAY